MLKQNSGILRKTLQATDIIVTVASFLLAYLARSHWGEPFGPLASMSEYKFLLFIIVPLWPVLLYYNDAYGSIRTKGLLQTLSPILKTVLIGGVLLMTILYIGKLELVSRAMLLLFLFFNVVLLSAVKISIYLFLHHIRGKGFIYRSVIIVGSGRRAEDYARLLYEHREWGMKVGIKACILADFYPHTIAKMSLNELMGVSLLVFDPTYRFEDALAVKRVVDILLAGTALVLISPVFIVTSLLIRLTSPGPIFFTQERCGLNGRRFNMLKFRTMVENAESMKDNLDNLNEMAGPVFKIKKDPRITRVGRFLRKYSLDELPQILNVIKGDMSIVGPRPPIPAEVEKYEMWQRRRLSVRPGITCSWQISGRHNVGFDDWMKLDLQYIDTWSFKKDIKIILKTIPAVLRGTGV